MLVRQELFLVTIKKGSSDKCVGEVSVRIVHL